MHFIDLNIFTFFRSSASTDSYFSGASTSTPSKFLGGQLGYEMTETSRFSEGDESIADFSERHGFCVASASHKGPTTFSAAFAEVASTFSSPGLSSSSFRKRPVLVLPSYFFVVLACH